MRFSIVLISLLAIATFPAIAAQEAPAQVLARDHDTAVRYAAALEAAPLGNDATEMRQWLLQWLTDTPDYTVTVCDILGPIPNQPVPYGPELLVQQMFGNVAYQITNPDVTDTLALQLAGVESALRAYSAIISTDQNAHITYFDNLLTEQQKGSLEAYIEQIVAKGCAEGGEA
jgi:hypothetical protein